MPKTIDTFIIAVFFNLIFPIILHGQVFIEPTFDKTTEPNFHLQSVELTNDTTILTIRYNAADNSWANLSPNTVLKDCISGKHYGILKVKGLPFSPKKRHFIEPDTIQVQLYLAAINTELFDLIEDNGDGFNIYGINLNKTRGDNQYTYMDMFSFYEEAESKIEEKDYHSAIDYTLKQLDASRYLHGEKSEYSAYAMSNLSMEYLHLRDEINAIEWGDKAIDILNSLSQDSIIIFPLVQLYKSVGIAYHRIHQNEKGLQYRELALALLRKHKAIKNISYEDDLSRLASDYYSLGEYPKALIYGKEVVELYRQKYENNGAEYAKPYAMKLSSLSEFYRKMGKDKDALLCSKQAYEIISDDSCKINLHEKISVHNNYALALFASGDNLGCIKLLDSVLGDSINILKEDYPGFLCLKLLHTQVSFNLTQDTISAINKLRPLLESCEFRINRGETIYYYQYKYILYELYALTNNLHQALKYLDKLMEVEKNMYGDDSIDYARMLIQNLVIKYILFMSENEQIQPEVLLADSQKAVNIIKKHINRSMLSLSKTDKTDYLFYYLSVLNWFIPTLSVLINTEEANALVYDTSLFYKGILLSSDKIIKEQIYSCGDKHLMNMYNEYLNCISHLEREMAYQTSSVDIDSLLSIVTEYEFNIIQKVNNLTTNSQSTDITWKDVKNSLERGDVAIEIVSYQTIDELNTYYDAYVIDSESTSPRMIHLCDEHSLQKFLSEDSKNLLELSQLIWGNLFDEIKDAQNIYISLSGTLNNIGIEYLPIGNGKYISDFINVYRLSSTRELCLSHYPIRYENAILFGGLDYNNIEEKSVPRTHMKEYQVPREIETSIIQRGGFNPLLESKLEIEQISEELIKKNIKYHLYSGRLGTEVSLKIMSGSKMNIIHLATHGMYVPSNNVNEDKRNLHFIISDTSPNADLETQALSRSFVVMSGGNYLNRKEGSYDGNNDGILTALEISHLAFIDLDLVVLSSCQSALGDIDPDGVYGLQRAFKLAGAKTILMSLDNVDDEATRILMVEFYRNLMSGKTKHQSLKDAQKYLREYDNGKYSDPQYWASFIMLDGLN